MQVYKASFVSLVAGLICAKAVAQTITFDDVTTSTLAKIPNGYANFNWQNMWVVDPNSRAESWLWGSGYQNGLVSGQYVAFNASANPAAFSTTNGAKSIAGFSGYFTAAWDNDDVLTVQGVANGTVVQTFQTGLVTSGPKLYSVNFSQDVNEVLFSTYSATGKPNSSQFALDNLTVIDPTPTPEPASAAVLGIGFAACLWRRTRRTPV